MTETDQNVHKILFIIQNQHTMAGFTNSYLCLHVRDFILNIFQVF